MSLFCKQVESGGSRLATDTVSIELRVPRAAAAQAAVGAQGVQGACSAASLAGAAPVGRRLSEGENEPLPLLRRLNVTDGGGVPSPSGLTLLNLSSSNCTSLDASGNCTSGASSNMNVWLPRKTLPSSPCILNKHCKGADPAVVAGRCINYRCYCNFPYSGLGCSKRLECKLWEREAGWEATDGVQSRCTLDEQRSTDSLFVCKCDTAGSIDLIVIEQRVVVPKGQVFFSFRSFSWADAAHYFSWDTFKRYPQALPSACLASPHACSFS